MQGVVRDDVRAAAGAAQTEIVSKTDALNQAIAEKVGQQKYKVWFENSTKLNIADGYLRIGVPNLFIANWIEKHFSSQIKQAVKEVTGEDKKLSFSLDAAIAEQQRRTNMSIQSQPAQNPVSRSATAEKMVGLSTVKLKMSLDDFVVGQSNQLAYSAAMAVASEEKSPFNPLFVHGGYGVGKTHLLQGICNAVRKKRPGTNWLYLSAEDFVNQFVLALKTKKLEAFRRRMRQSDLLAIDDIHFLASKPSTQEEFLHTFNTIDLAGKQVVLASDAHPKLIGQLSDKLVNRFICGMVVKIENPDFQTRCQICRQFASAKGASVPESVIKYISENLRTNVRELEGALLKVIAYSGLQNQKITLESAREILAEHLSRTDPIVHISDIESAVAAYFGISAADLHSAKKDRTISIARHFSMYLARKHTKMSSPEIGRCMGNKNHATVLLACRKVEEQIQQNSDLQWHGPSGNRVVKAKAILSNLETEIAG